MATLRRNSPNLFDKLIGRDTYYNTNKESGKTLADSQIKAAKQEKTILRLIRESPAGRVYSQPQMRRMYFLMTGKELPIASCSRAFRNLTKRGLLVKLGKEDMAMGDFGKMVHTWELAP